MIQTRNDFGKLYQSNYVTGQGAEIGVKEGWNAKQILTQYKGRIHLIDIWQNQHEIIQTLLNVWDNDAMIYRTTSARASQAFFDGELDWVYIDAEHTYEAVKSDHELWLPKVRTGGIISGHDYSPEFPGVVKMVDELIADGIKVFFTTEDTFDGVDYFSWYYFKS